MADKLKITKRGEDGYRISSLRLSNSMWDSLDRIAAESNRSRNEIITAMLEYGIDNMEIIDGKAKPK